MWAPVERGGGAAGAKAPSWERGLAHPLQASSRAAGRAPARAPEPHEPQRQGLPRRQEEQQEQEQHLAEPDPLRTYVCGGLSLLCWQHSKLILSFIDVRVYARRAAQSTQAR
jgi:hypothetical protein